MSFHITLDHISYAHPSEPPLFVNLSAVFSAPLTGLIGDNGCGKTTLMRLILGDLTPDSGSLAVPERMAYLPQDLGLDREQTLAELCGISEILWALQAVESGEYSPELYDTIGDNWDVEERTLTALATYGFTPGTQVDRDNPDTVRALFARQMHSFSGGEAVIAALASLMVSDPEFILLDEPTNNLDSAAKAQLFTALEALPCPALIISHDRDLLERMHVIAELHADRQGLAHLRLFEGNYSTYRQALDTEQQAAQRRVSEAKTGYVLRTVSGCMRRRLFRRTWRRCGRTTSRIRFLPSPRMPHGRRRRSFEFCASASRSRLRRNTRTRRMRSRAGENLCRAEPTTPTRGT